MSSIAQDHRIEELLQKSLLGNSIIDTQFYLFSSRSVLSGRVTKPRALCANKAILTNSSKYFSDLLNVMSSDPSLVEITADDQIPGDISFDDYGYESDSDLDGPPSEPPKTSDDTLYTPPSPQPKSGSENDDAPDSVASDISVLDHDELDKLSSLSREEQNDQESMLSVALGDHTTVCLQSLKTRRVLVRDTAFRTWNALLFYLYTGKVTFMPLESTSPQFQQSPSSSIGVPACSAKSMYRLASKVDLTDLRDQALLFLQNNISKQNILTELTSGLLSRYPELLKMELDKLSSDIVFEPIVTGLPVLMGRIAKNEFPHGAHIIIGLHERLLKKVSSPVAPVTSCPTPSTKENSKKKAGKNGCRCQCCTR